MKASFLRLSLVAGLLLVMSGCVRETTEGSARVFTFELWVPLTILFGGIVATIAGWTIRKANWRFGWFLVFIGPIAAIGFAPSLLRDRAVLDDQSYSTRSGIWGLTAVHHVRFEDLRVVRHISEEKRGRRGRKSTSYYLVCERKDGTSEKIPVGNNVMKTAAPHFIQSIKDRDIPFVDQT